MDRLPRNHALGRPTFGRFLQDHRRLAHLTYREAAQLLGVDHAEYSKIEHDRIPPPWTVEDVPRIAAALQINEGEWAMMRALLKQEFVPDMTEPFGVILCTRGGGKSAEVYQREIDEWNEWVAVGAAEGKD